MNEKLTLANTDISIDMRPKLQNRKLLGQVSTDPKFRNTVGRAIQSLSSHNIQADDFITIAHTALTDYAELSGDTHPNQSQRTLSFMPRIINALVRDEPQRTLTHEVWGELKEQLVETS